MGLFNRLKMFAPIVLGSAGVILAVQSTVIDLQTGPIMGAIKPTVQLRIESVDNASAVVTIDIPAVQVSDAADNGIGFKRLAVQSFATSMEIGRPAVPVRNIAMIVPENALLDVKVLEAQSRVLDDVLLHPALRQAAIRVDHTNEEPPFVMDAALYRVNAFYPGTLASVVRTVKYRGVGIGHIQIAPVQCNPVTKQVRVYTHLKLALTLKGGIDPTSALLTQRKTAGSLLANIALNARPLFSQPGLLAKCATNDADDAADIIIVTTPTFQAAAETLAVWHRMKGYEVRLAIANYSSFEAVRDTVHAFYQNTNPKPQYCILIGDREQVPAQNLTDEYNEQFISDLEDVCMDGNDDYVPDMASGRISVTDAGEAMAVVNKIIGYEKNPSTDAGFYQRLLSCAAFQDTDNPGSDGYEDRAFVKVCEDIKIYLETKGYSGQRIYFAYDWVTPQHWNNGTYAWGEVIPDYLKRPAFAWDGDAADVNAGINTGSFLVYHYDHGFSGGWGDPDFNTGNMQLSNGSKLPVVYSINCSSGDFRDNECFAEKMLRGQNGGAIGVVAASGTTYSGNNDALLVGMIDATWPGIKYAHPDNPNPNIPNHDRIFNLGDILTQGLAEMSLTWTQWGDKIHYQVYHLFGDPTTPMWTSLPQTITVTHANEIAMNASSLSLSNLNITSGTATLYDPQTKTLAGKVAISGAAATIPITTAFQSQGTAVLTITSHDFKPYSATIDIGGISPVIDGGRTAFSGRGGPVSLYLNRSLVAMVDRTGYGDVTVALFDCTGKLLQTRGLQPGAASLHLQTSGLAHGMYLVRMSAGAKQLLLRTVNSMN